MGDNLKAATRFVHQSISSLDHITTTPYLPTDRILDSLADLQSGAKAMRARAIYRAAQSAVDMVHKGQAEDKVNFELSVVRSLVVQYQHGLQDILGEQVPATPQTPIAPTPLPDDVIDFSATLKRGLDISQPAHAVAASLLDDLMMPLAAADAPIADEVVAAEASDTQPDILSQMVVPLIDFAPELEQRDALRRLSQIHGDRAAQMQDRLSGDYILAAAAGTAESKRVKMIAFEALMPELTNVVLTTARHLGKTASISYAAQGVEVNADLTEKLRAALSDLSVLLVTRSLETPDVRRARDESGAGHISIMASVTTGLLNLSIECTGRNITASDLDMASWNVLKNIGANVMIGRDDGRLTLTISGLRVRSFSPSQETVTTILEHAS